MPDLPEAERSGYHRDAVLPTHRADAERRPTAPGLGPTRRRRWGACLAGKLLAATGTLGHLGLAWAEAQIAPAGQPEGPPAQAMLVAPPPLVPAPPSEDPRVADAHADRVVFLPTAYTHPAGTYYFASTELVVLQAGYAITDRTQITVTATPPIETLVPLDLSLKTTVLQSTLVRVAGTISASGIMGMPGAGVIVVGRAGGVVQLCPDAACRSTLVAAANVTMAGVPLVASGFGGVLRLSRLVSLLGEWGTLLPVGNIAPQINGSALSLGVRLGWQRAGVDLAITRAWNAEGPGGTIPVLVASLRVL